MRREELYLRDIVEAADQIARFLDGHDHSSFLESDLVRSGVAQKLAIIGEASAHVSEDLMARYPEVEWPKIVGFRNILVHFYFGVDWRIVWQAATEETPRLRSQVVSILRAEFGHDAL
jgi:uncharacterized protein with HEPN domain